MLAVGGWTLGCLHLGILLSGMSAHWLGLLMVANGADASFVFGVGNHTWQYLLLVADVLSITILARIVLCFAIEFSFLSLSACWLPPASSQLRLAARCRAEADVPPCRRTCICSSIRSLSRSWKNCRNLGNCRNCRTLNPVSLKTWSLIQNTHHLLCMNAACLTPNKSQGN